jgi:hypothetical protein
MSKSGARVLLAMPFYERYRGQVLDAYDNGVHPKSEHQYVKFFCGDSFLARNFNTAWCYALNNRQRGFTHFAMIHSDVLPEGYWLDTMIAEMRLHAADLLSVVLPIKDGRGLTSTALYSERTSEIRRLTMHEISAFQSHNDPIVAERSNTFTPAIAGFPGWELLTSTGLWICDFTKPWVEKVFFEVRDRICRKKNGEFYPETAVDDWLFARKLHKLNLKLVSTTAVKAGHWGDVEFRNDVAFGQWKTDEAVVSFPWLDE